MNRTLLVLTLLGGAAVATPALAEEPLAIEITDVVFARIDADNDGYLSRAEIDTARAKRFVNMDRNGDGVVSRDEADRIAARARRAATRVELTTGAAFERYDVNGDGVIARGEFLATPPAWLRIVDVDEDGMISIEEIDRSVDILRSRRG